MKFLENMKVGSKIALLIVILLFFTISLAGYGLYAVRTINTELDIMFKHDLQGLRAAKEANIQLVSASRALRNLVVTAHEQNPEVSNKYLDDYKAMMDRLYQQMDKAYELANSDEVKKMTQETIAAVKKMQTEQHNVIQSVANHESLEQMTTHLRKAAPPAQVADDMMTDLGGAFANLAQQLDEEAAQLYENTIIIFVCLIAGALILGAVFGVMVMRAISTPLVAVANKAALVADGDLGQDFNLVRRDEIGNLSDALSQMVANLRSRIAEAEQKSSEAAEQSQKAQEAMGEAKIAQDAAEKGRQAILQAAENVDQVVARLSAATEELSAQIEESTRSADIQRDRVTSSATAMEEMNATVLEVARNAGVASEGSESARQKAENGAEIVKKSIEALNVVQANAETLNTEMEKLAEQAEAIGTVMTVINDIADQTNLLALNAAIEAARAGEAGRGFAVVADEVRKLAEKTMLATKEVGEAIEGIQQGSSRSKRAMGEAKSNVGTATNLALQSGAALQEIVDESINTADQVRNIAAAAEEQSAASDEITVSLEEINRLAQETALVMEQSSVAIRELSSQTNELQSYMVNLRG